jgi:hypothetical protein
MVVFRTMPRLRARAALALWGLFGCGDSEPSSARPPRPVAGCESFSYETCDIRAQACQRELFALVGCLRGDAAASGPPPVRLLDETSALALVAAASGGMTDGPDTMADPTLEEQAFRAQVRGLELLSMIAPGQIEEPSDVVEATFSGLVAYYLVATQEVVIIDRGEPVSDLDANMTLAHEFVHAQQDARHGLGSFGAELELDSDAVLGIASLIEGEASIYQYLLRFAYAGADLSWIDYPALFRDLVGSGTRATLAAGSPALTASSIFPYTYGTRYAGALWLSGGSSALDARYATPPLSSWDVLALSEPGEANAFRRFEQTPVALDGYSLVVDDVAGAWVTAAVLPGLAAPGQGAQALPALAGRWRGDHLWIYAAPGTAPAVAALWAIDWADADSASLFANLASALAVEGAVLHVDTRGASSRVVAAERGEDLEAWRERFAETVP